MDRRSFLQTLGLLGASALLPRPALAAAAPATTVIAAAWYASGELPPPFSKGVGHYVGVLQIDWAASDIRLLGAVKVPHRPHGIVATPDGSGFHAVAFRHGGWMLHADREGKVIRRIDTAVPDGKRTFDGHLELSPDGKWLFTTETDVGTGQGWVSVRRAATLERVAEFPTRGIDPHQLLLDDEGMVVVANGGIRWTLDNQKLDLDRMESSLVRINAENGELLGQWTLRDKQLSMRHIAWNTTPAGKRVLGIAMQGQHEGADERRNSPVLALWDGKSLDIPSRSPLGLGYLGDIQPGPGGGFLMSAEIHDRAVFWHPGDAAKLFLIAEMSRAAAIAPSGENNSLFIGGEKGIARWELNQQAQLLPWPLPIAPDHHWAVLQG
ncbi:DUF1513 domain-containing protein [Uliginosibacterium paludis]|uniref:DUF1513 domain-containing protein n=1 Tax=Uliginosibacterium paludis TaxID=1615952 RepID=A0ABV2CQU7_9RHOO